MDRFLNYYHYDRAFVFGGLVIYQEKDILVMGCISIFVLSCRNLYALRTRYKQVDWSRESRISDKCYWYICTDKEKMEVMLINGLKT